MDPVSFLIAYVSTRAPWAMPILAAYTILGPVIVHAGGWEPTRWGHFVLSTSLDLIGAMKGPRKDDPPPPVAPVVALCLALAFAGGACKLTPTEKAVIRDVTAVVELLCSEKDTADGCIEKLAAHRASMKVQANADAAAPVLGAVAGCADAGRE